MSAANILERKEMATGDTMTFVINDASTGGNNPQVKVTITENGDGTLSFKIEQLVVAGAYVGDLRGFFFDLPNAQEGALAGMTATNQVKNPDGGGTGTVAQTGVTAVVGNDSVMSAGGNSNNMNGLNSGGDGYDFGLEIGSEGIGKNGDDVRAFSFTLDATNNLTLADFANATFGVRVMSVGQDIDGNGSIDTARNGSSKIGETTFTLVHTVGDDTLCVNEETTLTGNIFTNDTKSATLDVMTVTGAIDKVGTVLTVGTATAIVDDEGANLGDDAEGATIKLNSDGSWTVDATTANALSLGEHIKQTFTVDVRQDHYTDGAHLNLDGSYTTSETFTVSVCGLNDGPDAKDDDFTGEDDCMDEDGSLIANVLADNGNGADSDVDRLDTIMVTGIYDGAGELVALGDDGEATVTLASGATVTIYATGVFTYDTNGAFSTLVDGEMEEDSFVYQLSDNNGATDDATATVCIDGDGTPGGGQGPADLVTAVDDDPDCGIDGLVKVTGNVLDNDDDSIDGHDLDITHVNGVALSTLDGSPEGNVYEFAITGGTLKIDAETGAFEFTYGGPGLPVGGHWDGDFTYTITDGDGSNDSVDSVYTATVDLCVSAAAGSQGFWTGGSNPVSEGFAAGVGTLTFDDFFHLDTSNNDALDVAGGRNWGDTSNGKPPNVYEVKAIDLTFLQALDFGQGNGVGDETTPVVTGNIGDLVREAATAVYNFYDAEGHDAFVGAYEAQFGAFADADNDAAVLADLRARVELAIETPDTTSPYMITELALQLHATHE